MAGETLSLGGKTATITGSGRETGIGAGIARALARNGCAMALHHVSKSSGPRAQKLAANISREFNVKTTVVRGAIDDPEAVNALVRGAMDGLGADHIDILINNAGVAAPEPLIDTSLAALENQFRVNVFSTIYMTQAVVKLGHMPRGGGIINIGSITSKMGLQGGAVYAAAKAAQDSLTASWAGELGRTHGITVNTIAPGSVDTDLSRPFIQTADGGESDLQALFSLMTRAEDRLGTPADIGDAVLLLVSEKSRWITAQWISVSGGVIGTM